MGDDQPADSCDAANDVSIRGTSFELDQHLIRHIKSSIRGDTAHLLLIRLRMTESADGIYESRSLMV
jgi:hypothetical protein